MRGTKSNRVVHPVRWDARFAFKLDNSLEGREYLDSQLIWKNLVSNGSDVRKHHQRRKAQPWGGSGGSLFSGLKEWFLVIQVSSYMIGKNYLQRQGRILVCK